MINDIMKLLDWFKMNIYLWDKKSKVVFKEGEIWWCRLGMTIGSEIFGKGSQFMRPVLIVKKFNQDLFLAIPLTSKLKEGSWYAPLFHGGKERRAVLVQIRTLDRKRLTKRIGVLNNYNFERTKSALQRLIGSG